ncbi:hypothetical protein LOK49_LG03G03265 [Camellia lanceoleosa]|uniref:Uncharacterized protein n=1 Tax=Camellia lanceoleosa TaxID=1840588 RepID=A0ACC0IDY0_9ERIC|nr:hypothetical protein LOK49_LG03G03265 [Camellia lanceoleosa]
MWYRLCLPSICPLRFFHGGHAYLSRFFHTRPLLSIPPHLRFLHSVDLKSPPPPNPSMESPPPTHEHRPFRNLWFRLYLPSTTPPPPSPLLIYFHGGGFLTSAPIPKSMIISAATSA